MEEKDSKDLNILLVKEKGSDKLKVVAGIGKDGRLETVEANAENASRFLTFDRGNRNETAGIMSAFNQRVKNQKDFQLYQVLYGKFEKLKEGIEEVLSRPHNAEGKEMLKKYEINPKDFTEKKTAESPKVLLMRDEGEGNKLKVVRGIDKKGKIDAVDPMKAKQSDFLIIDRHADPLANFFKNFINQAKNPSHTGFYAVTVDMLDKVLQLSDAALEKFRINPRDYLKNEQEESKKETVKQSETEKKETTQEKRDTKNTKEEKDTKTEPVIKTTEKEEEMETTTNQRDEFKQFDTNRIPESEYRKYGITPESLKDELNAMSYGFKSPHLVDINPNIEGVYYSMKARLSLEEQPDGSLKFIPYPQQQQVDLDKPFQGIMLPDDVKENLLATGNAGRIVELEPYFPGEKVPSLVSIDKLTNRLEAVPLDKITISPELKGVELSPEQQQALGEGKKVLVEGMTSKKTMGSDNPNLFDAYVQFSAAKGGYEFSYDGLDRNRYRQDANTKHEQGKNQEQQKEQQNQVRIPKKLLGIDLDAKQQNTLREGKAVYVQGMMKDAKGEPFNAYVKVNNEKGKLDFYKWNPDRAKKQGAEVKPAEGNKTQVAVNSHGKTNEATKNLKVPLKQGQQRPTDNQQEQQNKRRVVKKSSGHKM